MAHEHKTGVSGVYDRTPLNPDWARVLFREDRIAQAAEINEAQSIIEGRGRRVSDRLMTDGARLEGAEISVSIGSFTPDVASVLLTPGMVYAAGDVRTLPEHRFNDIPTSGVISIGIRIVSEIQTEEDNPDLLGLHPGTEAEGEAGAVREIERAVWGWSGDGITGDLYQVYMLKDGAPVDQTAPASMSDVSVAIATYDRDAHGSYVVNGCKVYALGKVGDAQHFSIGEGVANILGNKRTRTFALRHQEVEEWDISTVDAEVQTFADNGTGTAVIKVNHGPISALNSAIITKQRTVTITKGVAGSLDALPNTSVSALIEVKQSSTIYVAGTSYRLTGDRVDWSPAGAEPAPGSTYSVTYRYLEAVQPSAMDDDTLTLTGGVTATPVLLSYSWKMPRADLLCLDRDGLPVYVYGISSPAHPRAPAQPSTLLALAQIVNDWRGPPEVINTDVRSVPYSEMWVYFRKMFDMMDLIAMERLKSDIGSREPVAKKGVFVDPWIDDSMRDQGEAQTAAIVRGTLQLGIDVAVHRFTIESPTLLDYSEEVLIAQELVTGSMKINPYQNFNALPIGMSINPAIDFWTDRRTDWASAVTEQIAGPVTSQVIRTSEFDFFSAATVVNSTISDSQSSTANNRVEQIGQRNEQLPFLRQIPVDYKISGMSEGEILTELTFDGINVKPAGTQVANAAGEINGVFTIPPNVPAGSKRLLASTAAGRVAVSTFVGQGSINIDVLRQVTTVTVSTNRIIREVTSIGLGGGGGDGSSDRAEAGDPDPLAQTFSLMQGRFVAGVDFKITAVGDRANDILVEIHPVENGFPTTEVLAQATVRMAEVNTGDWLEARFSTPLWLNPGVEYAIMLKTNDADHAVAIATIGDFDAAAQRFVSGQPYTVGVLLSSANARTWTAHQSSDLAFRLVGCVFAPTTKTVELGTLNVTNMSDVLILAGIEKPTAAAELIFEIELPDGDKVKILADQAWQLTQYVTGAVKVRAILTGSRNVSPVIYPGSMLIDGELKTSGTYVTRTFNMGAAIRMSAFVKAMLPAGSTMLVEIDNGSGVWTEVDMHSADVLGGGWVEREYRKTPYTATSGRLRITLTGSPSARPMIADMRATAI